MAKTYPHKQRSSWRIEYTLTIGDKKKRRPKYTKERAVARVWERQLADLEIATQTGLARSEQIQEWIDKKWIKLEEAEVAFPGFRESVERQRVRDRIGTDYDRLEQACAEYSMDVTRGSGGADLNHSTALAHFRHPLAWLKAQYPDISSLDEAGARAYKAELDAEFAPWTVFHRMTKLRIILYQAISLRMAT